MNYPIVLHKDNDSDYGVTVPDLPGCFSAGETLDEAMAKAKEAIELYLETIIQDGKPVPVPGSLEDYKRKRDYSGGTWAIVSVDPTSLRIKVKRVNITIPERTLDAADRFSKVCGCTRSGLIVNALWVYMDRADDPAMKQAKRGRSTLSRKSKQKAG